MCADNRYYAEYLYPLQDQVLALVATLETEFYLTGDPVDLAQRLCTATHKHWEQVRWIEAPEPTRYLADLNALGEALLLV